MSNKLIITILLVLSTSFTFAQTSITLKVKQTFGAKALLYQFEGKQRIKVDSCTLNSNGDYVFTLPANAPQGQYRVQVGKSGIFDILVNEEPDIAFESVVYAIQDSLKVIKSDENKIFISYNRKKNDKEQKKWFIESLLNYYPDSSKLAIVLRDELGTIESEFSHEANLLASIDTSLLVSSYIKLDMSASLTTSTKDLTFDEKSNLWWNGVDLKNSGLLNTPLLEKKLWDYIEFLQCDDLFDKEQQDSIFIDKISALLRKPMSTPIRKLITSSLCFGFSESDYYSVINFLIDNGGQYAQSITQDEEAMKRIELEKNISIGSKALNFSFMPINGDKEKKLSDVAKDKYTLLVFWSAWCPHCVEMIPEFKELYAKYQNIGFEIVGISIDINDEALPPFIEENKLPWINTVFTNKNEDKLANSFNVDGTPKIILLDRNMRVISKPTSIKQLTNKLKIIIAENL